MQGGQYQFLFLILPYRCLLPHQLDICPAQLKEQALHLGRYLVQEVMVKLVRDLLDGCMETGKDMPLFQLRR